MSRETESYGALTLVRERPALTLVPPADRVSGPGATLIMAAFTHLNPEGSRFSDGSYGVYYAADTLATAVAEVSHHRARFLARTAEPEIDVDLRWIQADLRQPAHDLRAPAWPTRWPTCPRSTTPSTTPPARRWAGPCVMPAAPRWPMTACAAPAASAWRCSSRGRWPTRGRPATSACIGMASASRTGSRRANRIRSGHAPGAETGPPGNASQGAGLSTILPGPPMRLDRPTPCHRTLESPDDENVRLAPDAAA